MWYETGDAREKLGERKIVGIVAKGSVAREKYARNHEGKQESERKDLLVSARFTPVSDAVNRAGCEGEREGRRKVRSTSTLSLRGRSVLTFLSKTDPLSVSDFMLLTVNDDPI